MMRESIEGSAILDDVEEGTFIGFCEFAYRGAYTTLDRREDNDDGQKEDQQGRIHSEMASGNSDAESSQHYAEQHAPGAESELA